MWIIEPQKVNERIEYLGARDMCVFLLKGREYMLIEGGMSYIAPILFQQFEERGIDTRRITKYLILHSHFDHCGAVPPIKRKFPWIEVVASHRTRELYQKEKVIAFIRGRNRDMLKELGMAEDAGGVSLDFDNLEVDIPVGQDDVIDLGDGVSVEIIEVPGHSTCSIAAYTQPDRALFASDAGGIPNHDDVIYPSGNEDFILYQRSLEKMSRYPSEIHCPARFGVYTGEEGWNYMSRSMASAEDYRLRAVKLVEEIGVDKTVDFLFKNHFETAGTSDVPADIMKALMNRMVKVIMADHEVQAQG